MKEENNYLIYRFPDIASEWDYEKNGEVRLETITCGSGKKAWWKCRKGHEWEAVVNHRTGGRGCPYCSGQRAILGETDLATMRPDIALEWHPKLNGDKIPAQFTVSSNKKVWWLCKKGHEWRAMVNHRTRGCGCPYCSGRRVIPGETDLATMRPDVALEWHPKLNGKKTPEQFTVSSNKKVWWLCEQGHEWRTYINARTKGSGCPYCYRRGSV